MPPRKRPADEITSTRRSSRRVSATKSQYFEGSEDTEESDAPPPKKRGRPPKKQPKKEESEEPYEDELAQEPEEEEDDDDEDDEDAPPKVTIIPLEKLRDTDGVEYEDFKLHKNTMLFLRDLKAHNQRPWLKSHDGEYRRALTDWNSFVECASETVIAADETIPELPIKDVIFRIHRDIRFSKDPTPYKPHFSAAWSRTGRKGPYACYYIHCEPKKSFIGGGLWCPSGDQMQKLRASIDERPNRWRRALNDEAFKRIFLPKAANKSDPNAALLAFAEKNKENALKTKPKGFTAEHRDIALLKLRNFTVGTQIDDSIFYQDDAQEKISEIIRPMVGYLTSLGSFLNSIVMPDPGQDDDSDEDEDEGEEGPNDDEDSGDD
ncbi:hypothetical protein FOXB_07126 [Fusarium oxysporum f. sp. conglutinans Fo5176]|uniref:DUF2461 domain-containing protein n=1 Tax=Fusarium oxysporum (strain Fo5176) TaxID=660025 RepID=F9FL47_FUSOF|nr:hypothetical protein FOXB_07126 [Fusarium oxysporum f. sp. conglutinans Fo5176]